MAARALINCCVQVLWECTARDIVNGHFYGLDLSWGTLAHWGHWAAISLPEQLLLLVLDVSFYPYLL